MNHARSRLHQLETGFTRWLVVHSLTVLRVSLGFVFLAFGVLKFFPGVSPAQELATSTTTVLTFGLVPAGVSLVMVALLECAIGVGLIQGRYMRLVLLLLAFQMLGAMSPLLLFAGDLFSGLYHAPTLEAQYIVKDVVLVSVGMVLGATIHGARIVSERVRRAEDYTRYRPSTDIGVEGRAPAHRVK